MSITIRQNIMTALIDRLKEIRIVNGFNTDIGSTVYDWLDYSTDSTVWPCIIVRDGTDTVETMEPHLQDRRLDIIIMLVDNGTMAEMRAYIGDVQTALKNQSFGQYWMTETAVITEALHEEDKIYTTTIGLSLQYKTALFDPYTEVNC